MAQSRPESKEEKEAKDREEAKKQAEEAKKQADEAKKKQEEKKNEKPKKTPEEILGSRLKTIQTLTAAVAMHHYKDKPLEVENGKVVLSKTFHAAALKIKTDVVEKNLGENGKLGTKEVATILDSKKGGIEGLDSKLDTKSDNCDARINTFKTKAAEIEAKLETERASIANKAEALVDKLITASATLGNRLEPAKVADWQQGFQANDTLKEIQDFKKTLTEDKAKITADDDKAKAEKALIDNQIKKLEDLEKELRDMAHKLQDETLKKIENAEALDGDTLQAANKKQTAERLKDINMWVGTRGADKKMTPNASADDVKPGTYKGNIHSNFFASEPTAAQKRATFAALFLTGGLASFVMVGLMLWGNKNPTYVLSEENGVGWNSKEGNIKGAFDFFESSTNYSKNMEINKLDKDVSVEYIKEMKAEADKRGITLSLSPELEKTMTAANDPRLGQINNILHPGAQSSISIGNVDEEKSNMPSFKA